MEEQLLGRFFNFGHIRRDDGRYQVVQFLTKIQYIRLAAEIYNDPAVAMNRSQALEFKSRSKP